MVKELKKFIDKIERSKSFWILLIICILFFVLRFPSLFEPYWYGDEGIYLTIGSGLLHGRQIYTEVWDNKPPLLFIIYALANADLFIVRLYSLIFGLGSVIVFFLLSRLLFKDRKISIFTTSIFALLFGLPVIEGNIANSENFMLLIPLISGLIIYKLTEKEKIIWNKKNAYLFALSGFLLGLNFLIKVVGLFDFAAFLIYLLLIFVVFRNVNNKRSLLFDKKSLKAVGTFVIAFLLPVILTFPIFYLLKVLPYYLDAAFGRNVDYVGWGNQFIIPQGLLILKLILLASFVTIAFLLKNKFSKRALFISSWIAFSLFSAYFSQRLYPHYQLLILPSFSLLLGYLFLKQETIKKVFAVFFIALVFVSVYFYFDHWSIERTAGYYTNFIKFISHKKDFAAYQSFFDPQNVKDYEIAAYIKQNTKLYDTIFLWGNSAQIYVLSQTLPPGRYSTAYHIKSKQEIAETAAAIKKRPPKYIIITRDESNMPFDLSQYNYKLTLQDTDIYESTF